MENVLEKILEEIREIEKKYVVGHNVLFALGVTGMATEISSIIRSHMVDVPKCGECSRRKWYQIGYKDGKNDGWIPVEERMPTKEEFLKDDGRFILDDGNRRYQGLFDIYDGKFKFSRHISGIHYELFEDKCVIAWQPLPEPYKEV